MSIFIQATWSLIVTNWQYITAAAVFIAAFTYWLVNIYNITKLRLEIKKLRKDLEEKKATKIPVATIEEIIEFASKNPDPRKIQRYLHHKFTKFNQSPEPLKELPSAQSQQLVEALAKLETRTVLSLFDVIYGTTAILAMLVVLGKVFLSFNSFNQLLTITILVLIPVIVQIYGYSNRKD